MFLLRWSLRDLLCVLCCCVRDLLAVGWYCGVLCSKPIDNEKNSIDSLRHVCLCLCVPKRTI